MKPETEQVDPINKDELTKPPLRDTKYKQKTTRTLDGKIPSDGCDKTFTRKHDLKKHKV